MTFIVQKKKTVLVRSGVGFHLFIIATDACSNNMHLLVPLCSIKPPKYYDPTCVIKASEQAHPFIKVDSYVSYKDIQTRNRLIIVKYVDDKSYIEMEEISDSLHKRICEGITIFEHIPKFAKNQFIKWPN